MRLWSFHPKYLNRQDLGACWYEGISKAQTGLQGGGYKNHSQLQRFKIAKEPLDLLALYLSSIWHESLNRGFSYNWHLVKRDIPSTLYFISAPVTAGQLHYEWQHYLKKIEKSDSDWYRKIREVRAPEPHPMFYIIEGEIEEWERVKE